MRILVERLILFSLLLVILAVGVTTIKSDALTFDELAHIGAGYSYVKQQDYRLNPEHPPLAKDLAAFPLLFLNLNFPEQSASWTQAAPPPWWVQFDFGRELLYQSGNNPSQIIFWSRIPMLSLLIALAWFLFRWGKELGGTWVGLGALFLLAFSPTFLAHGRLVTTDVAAALGAILAMYYWLKFLFNPTRANVIKAGVAFGIAMLFKFSLLLLVPAFIIITLLYAFLRLPAQAGPFPLLSRIQTLGKYILLSLGAVCVSIVLIGAVYQFHIWHYSQERQIRDTAADLAPNTITGLKEFVGDMASQPVLRPFAQYLRGVAMASQRAAFGNTVYFLGEISGKSFPLYFPIVYFFKEPLAFHLLSFLITIGFAFLFLKAGLKAWGQRHIMTILFSSLISWIRANFTVVAFFVFINIYWTSATLGNLNIGVRHLLPVYPFSFLLLAWGAKELWIRLQGNMQKLFASTLLLLGGWYAYSSLAVFPHYISYYNELVGGAKNGYQVAVDSNYDWGQDFYLLKDFVEKNNINRIYVDYFGGENPAYWLGETYRKLNPFHPPRDAWVAVSVNQLVGGLAKPVPGFDQPSGYYDWLLGQTPVARAGTSIFIYHLAP